MKLDRIRAGIGWVVPRAQFVAKDLYRGARHGRTAPRYAQLVWVDPQRLQTGVLAPVHRSRSGSFVDGDWDRQRMPVRDFEIVSIALRHWSDGLSWEELGAYDSLLAAIEERGHSIEGCRTFDDVVNRYRRIDRMFEQVREERQLRTRSSLAVRSFREEGGVVVHIGHDSEPLFGFGGCHRLAAALVLELRCIPAQLSVVHSDALHTWRDGLLGVGRTPPSTSHWPP